jgi:serine/threonine protein kinase
MNTNFEFVKVLGEGGQGTVCMYRDILSQVEYAVKFAPENTTDQSLLTECLLLKDNGDGKFDKLPRYNIHSTHNQRRFLVMEYLEYSVDEYLKQYEKDPNLRD